MGTATPPKPKGAPYALVIGGQKIERDFIADATNTAPLWIEITVPLSRARDLTLKEIIPVTFGQRRDVMYLVHTMKAEGGPDREGTATIMLVRGDRQRGATPACSPPRGCGA